MSDDYEIKSKPDKTIKAEGGKAVGRSRFVSDRDRAKYAAHLAASQAIEMTFAKMSDEDITRMCNGMPNRLAFNFLVGK